MIVPEKNSICGLHPRANSICGWYMTASSSWPEAHFLTLSLLATLLTTLRTYHISTLRIHTCTTLPFCVRTTFPFCVRTTLLQPPLHMSYIPGTASSLPTLTDPVNYIIPIQFFSCCNRTDVFVFVLTFVFACVLACVLNWYCVGRTMLFFLLQSLFGPQADAWTLTRPVCAISLRQN